MSNDNLKRKVESIQIGISELEFQNECLSEKLDNADQELNRMCKELSFHYPELKKTLTTANETIHSAKEKADAARDQFEQIRRQSDRFKQVETANKKIRELNNRNHYEFNHYRTVRKLSAALIDHPEHPMINESVVYRIVEKQYLRTPDYWLTAALISVLAWMKDNPALAGKAVERAVNLDGKNSCLFYMLFHVCMGREKTASNWLLAYRKYDRKMDEAFFLTLFSLDGDLTVSDSLFSEYIQYRVAECMHRVDYREKDRISQCRQNMMAMSTEEPHDFPLLSANCGKYRTMALMLRMASNNRHLLQFVQKLSAAEEDEGLPYWRKYMDELLRMPTAAEQDNLQQIQFYEQIVKYCGDEKRVKIAKAETSPGKTKDEKKRDLVTCMVDWIYDQSRREISPGMRRSMFLHLKSLQEKAFTSWFETYRAMEDDCCPIQIQDYCTEADFSDEDGEIRKIKDYFEEKKKLKYQSLKNTPLYVLCTAGMLCAGGAFFLHPFLLSGSAVCAVAAGVSRMRFRFQKQEIDCSIRKQEDSALRILGGLFTEYHQIKKQYREYDALSGQIMDIMKGE